MIKKTIFEKYPILKTISQDKFPKHVCIIPDGNGRWAKKHNKFAVYGHAKGMQVLQKILKEVSEISEIKIVTLWAFSADNWKRSEGEINGLMKLLTKGISEGIMDIKARNSRFVHLGRKDRLPKSLLSVLEKAEEETKNNTGQIVAIAIDFGGEDQDIRIVQKALNLPSDIKVDQDLLWSLRDTQGLIKSSDLLIRTSGEMRTSDIGWINGASTEIFIIDKLFPDITTNDIIDAVVAFSKRDRRFGGRHK